MADADIQRILDEELGGQAPSSKRDTTNPGKSSKGAYDDIIQAEMDKPVDQPAPSKSSPKSKSLWERAKAWVSSDKKTAVKSSDSVGDPEERKKVPAQYRAMWDEEQRMRARGELPAQGKQITAEPEAMNYDNPIGIARDQDELAAAKAKPAAGPLGRALTVVPHYELRQSTSGDTPNVRPDMHENPANVGEYERTMAQDIQENPLAAGTAEVKLGGQAPTSKEEATKAYAAYALRDTLTDKQNLAEGDELNKRHADLQKEVGAVADLKTKIDPFVPELKKLKESKDKLDGFKLDKTSQESVNEYNTLVKQHNAQLKKAQGAKPLIDEYNSRVQPLKEKLDAFTEQAKRYSPKGVPSLSQIYDNFDAITKQEGIRGNITNREYVDILMTAAIGEQIFTKGAMKVAGMVGGYMAAKEVESAAVQKISGEPYKFGQGRELKELAGTLPGPLDTAADIVEFLGPAGASGKLVNKLGVKMEQKGYELAEKYLRNIMSGEGLRPESKFTLDQARVRKFFTGKDTDNFTPEEKAMYDALQEVEIPNKTLKDIFLGRKTLDVEVTADQVTKVKDKPAWAKIKGFF